MVYRILNTNFTLNNCLFGSLKLTKNADSLEYKYSGYGIGSDSRSECLFIYRRKHGEKCHSFWSCYELMRAY